MKKTEDQSLYFTNQHVQRAMNQAIIIDCKHWLAPEEMRTLLAKLGADYNLICRYLPDRSTIRDNGFVIYFCIEDVISLAEKINSLEPGKSHSLRLPYRHDRRAEGYVSTANYDC